MGTSISEQADNYAQVIVGQIAQNFQELEDSIESCTKLKDTLDEYKNAHSQSKWAKFIFEKNIDEYTGYVDKAKEETGCRDYDRVEPLAVGLFGEWGSGKTYQLKLIKHNILYPPKEIKFPQTTIPVFFNAWRFEKEEHIIIPLFQTLLQAVEEYEYSLEEKAAKGYRTLSMYLKLGLLSLHKGLKVPSDLKSFKESLTNLEFKKAIDEIIDTSKIYKEMNKKVTQEVVGEQTLSELLKPEQLESIYLNIPRWIEKITFFEKVNFVFLIDDLDRCLPENTLKMLESIKLFLDVPSCAFVLAVDDDVVERGVVHHYRDYLSIYHNKDTESAKGVLQHELPITGHEYLEKMIQLPLRLPVIDTVKVREFLEECSVGWIAIIDKKYEPVITLDLDNKDSQAGKFRKKSEFLLDFFAQTIPPKPRKIKRTALLFESKLKLLNKLGLDMDLILLAKITLLELFAPKLLRFIQNNGYSTIFNALCHFKNVSYEFSSNRALEQDLQGIPVDGVERYQNSLIERDIIHQYIKEGINHPDFKRYTAKEKDLYLKLMELVKEHYNSRIAFNIDAVFDESIEPEQLTRILELRDVRDRVVIKDTKIKSFNVELYQRLFRDGDVDAWRDSLSEHEALLSAEQVVTLIEEAKERKDKTFNNLPFIVNPEWVGIVANYVSNDDYIILLKSAYDERFITNKELSFSIDMFQMTFSEYDKYCEITNKEKPEDNGWGRGRRPVIFVSWNDAKKYIKWLNNNLQLGYSLPMEEHWNIANNNGNIWQDYEVHRYFEKDNNELKNYAWYNKNSGNKTHRVGELKPNNLDLYDLYGNVWEWCEDSYKGGNNVKIINGFSWDDSSFKYSTDRDPYARSHKVGFRLFRIFS